MPKIDRQIIASNMEMLKQLALKQVTDARGKRQRIVDQDKKYEPIVFVEPNGSILSPDSTPDRDCFEVRIRIKGPITQFKLKNREVEFSPMEAKEAGTGIHVNEEQLPFEFIKATEILDPFFQDTALGYHEDPDIDIDDEDFIT